MNNVSHNKLPRGEIFYQATVQFKDSFTRQLGLNVKEVKSISVNVDFDKLLTQGASLGSEMCVKTFQYMGIKEQVSI